MMLTIAYGLPFALLSMGLLGFLRIAARRNKIRHLPRRRALSSRAS